eukprot:scaffold1056_cov564-Prasinococcus_capsulatus_cf.AAC.7
MPYGDVISPRLGRMNGPLHSCRGDIVAYSFVICRHPPRQPGSQTSKYGTHACGARQPQAYLLILQRATLLGVLLAFGQPDGLHAELLAS